MRVLILGGGGMLGHKLYQTLRSRFDTWATIRTVKDDLLRYRFLDPAKLVQGVDALRLTTVKRAFDTIQPTVAINTIGIIKQLPEARDPILSIQVNSLFPHQLAEICRQCGTWLIHISTDCVFSGRRGAYTENDVPDPVDLYGKSKLLGEVSGFGSLTLRTSMVGRELRSANGLVEWFLSNRGGAVRGYNRVMYSGLTTAALAELIAWLIDRKERLTGLYHVSSDAISKYDLLCMLRDACDVDVRIEPYPEVIIDRTLDSFLFKQETRYTPPTWASMIAELAADQTPYDELREGTCSSKKSGS